MFLNESEYQDKCKTLVDIVNLLALVYDDLLYTSDKKLNKCSKEILEEFYYIIQNSDCFFVTDQCGDIISNQCISYKDNVIGYGLKIKIDCLDIIVDFKKSYAKSSKYKIIPINKLLYDHQNIDEADYIKFAEAICCLKEFYKGLPEILEIIYTKHFKNSSKICNK